MAHWDQIKSYSGLTAIVSLYGIASLLVVFLGEYLGFGLGYQVIIIALLLLTWPLAVLINHSRKRKERKADRESEAASPTTAELSSDSRRRPVAASRVPSRVYNELARGVEEVVQWLRSTKLRSARRGDPVYSFPWFLVAGAPASGKTSLLLSSGLDFHAMPSQRRAEQNVIRPTRDVDWRVTDWCVLLDSTGRYQTEGPDGEEWTALVETITKHRKRRPIDGLVMTADAGTLLASSEAQIEQHAKILRSRLDQLNVQVQARFPVYLVFTHADSMEGFEEFFRLPEAAERGQVWGTTIPLEQSASAHALFDVEFDYLYDTLMRYRLLRLSAQESPAEQLFVFDFPLRFAEARRRLGLFTSALFRPNPFSESPLLRGFYFTSSSPSNGSGRGSVATGDETLEKVAIAGEGCFTERFFNDVLLRDKDLAASFQQGKTNPARLRNVLLAGGFALIAFVMVGLIASFFTNAGLMAEGDRIGSTLKGRAKLTADEDVGNEARYELRDMESLRELLVRLDEYNRAWLPFHFHRFGLYQGKVITPYLRAIYFEAISRRFFNPMIADVEKELRSGPRPASSTVDVTANADSKLPEEEAEQKDPLEDHYDLLKAYLMLSENPEKAESSLLNERFRDAWVKSAAGEDESLAFRQLQYFAAAAESDRGAPVRDVLTPRTMPTEELIRESCRALQAYKAEDRYYKRGIDEVSRGTKSIVLAEMLGGGTPQLNGAATVRGAFTVDGYEKMMDVIKAAPVEVMKDWVCPDAPGAKDQKVDTARLTTNYANQYIDAWRKFLEKVQVREYNSDTEAASMLSELSKDDSQLAQVLKEVERQTNISRSTASFLSKINIFASKSAKEGDAASIVQKAFQPLITFVGGEGDESGSRMKEYLNRLTQARDALNLAVATDAEEVRRFLNDPKGGLPTVESQVKPAIEELRKTTGGREAANLLEQPLGNLRTLLLLENAGQIESQWVNQLYDQAHALEQRYPFVDSQNEAPITELSKFFNPSNGTFWSFFNVNLKPSFELAQGGWRIKPGSKGLKVSPAFVDYLNAAQRLTDALFPTAATTAGFDFQLSAQPPAGATLDIQVEGRWIPFSGTLQPVKWTGSGGVMIRVSQGLRDPQTLSIQSNWWPLRMVERTGRRNGDKIDLVLPVESTTVRATVQPPSPTSNPFERSLFTRLRAPKSTQ